MLRDDGPLVALAGATDLYVSLNFGTLSATRFLDLWALEPLRRIEMRGDVLSLGALATYTSLTRSRLVKQRLPMLVDAARQVGGVQIQNRGTIGGNIANGSPAGDTLPVFAAAEAIVVIRSAGAERRAAFTEFYSGYRTSVLRPEELIVAVEIPAITGRQPASASLFANNFHQLQCSASTPLAVTPFAASGLFSLSITRCVNSGPGSFRRKAERSSSSENCISNSSQLAGHLLA